MMVKVALADELGDVPLVYIAPVQPEGGPAVDFPDSTQGVVRRHHRSGDVDGLDFDGQEFSDLSALSDVGDDEIDISEAGHTDFAGDHWIARRIPRPASLDDIGHEINRIKPLRADAYLFKFASDLPAD